MIKEKFYDFNPDIKKIISSNIRKYSYDFIRRIETSGGKSGFSVETLYKIATVLEVSMDELTKDEK